MRRPRSLPPRACASRAGAEARRFRSGVCPPASAAVDIVRVFGVVVGTVTLRLVERFEPLEFLPGRSGAGAHRGEAAVVHRLQLGVDRGDDLLFLLGRLPSGAGPFFRPLSTDQIFRTRA